MAMKREMQAMTRSTICGQGLVFDDHAVKPPRDGRFLVALKIVKVAASMERTIKLQLKLMPRRKNFATRTRNLIFWPC